MTICLQLFGNRRLMIRYIAVAAVEHAIGFEPSLKYLHSLLVLLQNGPVPLVSVIPSSTLGKVCDG